MAQSDNSFFEQMDKDLAAAQVPAAEPNPSDAPVPTESQPTLGDAFADTARGLAGGVESAGRGMASTGIALTNATVKALVPSALRDSIPQIPDPFTGPGAVPRTVEEPKFFVNKMLKDVTSLGIGLYTGSTAMKGAGIVASESHPLLEMMKQQAVGSFLVRDPHDERLSNLIEAHPALSNPLTAWLAADPNDSVADGKFKAALEDTLTVPLANVLFKTLGLAYKQVKGMFGGKPAPQVAQELEVEIKALNEAQLPTEKYVGNVEKPLKLNTAKPTESLTMPNEVDKGFRDVELNKLITRADDHVNGLVPEKVTALRQVVNETPEKLAPLSVEEDAAGKLYLLDGRHRVAAAQAEGYTSATAKVVRSKDTEKLMSLQEQAGGEKPLVAAAAKMEKGREMFNLTPEQFTEFEKKLQGNVLDGMYNNLFTEGLPQGAFNYSKMANRADVHATLQSLADVIAPNLEKNVKSYQSFREIESTAALFGAKPDVMIANLRTWGTDAKNMPATLVAAKNWAQSLSDEIFRDARSIAVTGVGGESAKIEMLRKVSVLADIEGMMKSVQTAAARTTAAGRIRTSPKYSGEQMIQMLDEAGGADKVLKLAEKLAMTEGDPSKVTAALRVSWIRKIVDTHNELWINSLLSGIGTHMINMGTALSNTMIKPANIAIGGAIRGDFESMKQGFATWRAMGSLIKDSFEMSRRAWAIERPLISITDKQLEIESTISAGNYGLNPEKWLGQGVNWLGKAARLPSRFLGAEDEFFKQLNYRANLTMQANHDALNLVKAGKLDMKKMVDVIVDGKVKKLTEFDAYVLDKFKQGFEYEDLPDFGMTATRGTNEKALQYANEATFTQSLKVPTWMGNRSFAETIYQAANSHPVLRGTVLPFVKVPANLLREGFSYTPGINLLRKQFWADLAEGGPRASEAIGKMATGGLLLTGGIMMAVEGKLTGAAPTDKEIRSRMYEKNWQPYSFVFENSDGTKTYVPFARFDPYGIVFGLVADIAQTYQHIDETSRHSFAAMSTMAMANLLNSKGYLKGLVDALDVLSGGQGEGGLNKMQKVMQSYAAGHVPNILRLTQTNTELKEVRGVMDAMLSKLPFFSDLVPAKRGYFGDKVMAPVGWPWNGLLPSKPSVETSDPALLELARLADGPAQAQFSGPDKRLGTLDLTTYKNTNGVTAYDRMLEILNESDFHDKMNDLVTSDKYKAGTDGDGFYHIGSKVVDIKKLEKKYHDRAKDQMLKEFQSEAPTLGFDLRAMSKEDERNRKATRHGRESTPIDRLLELNQ